MAAESKLKKMVESGCPVFYFYSEEAYLVRREMAVVRQLLLQEEAESTVLDGAAPEIEQIIMAAGTISFFGTRRVVELPDLAPPQVTATRIWTRFAMRSRLQKTQCS